MRQPVRHTLFAESQNSPLRQSWSSAHVRNVTPFGGTTRLRQALLPPLSWRHWHWMEFWLQAVPILLHANDGPIGVAVVVVVVVVFFFFFFFFSEWSRLLLFLERPCATSGSRE